MITMVIYAYTSVKTPKLCTCFTAKNNNNDIVLTVLTSFPWFPYRALEVFDQHGVPMSSLLADQHGEEGGGALSGPLRYPNPCVIWVQCQQQGEAAHIVTYFWIINASLFIPYG